MSDYVDIKQQNLIHGYIKHKVMNHSVVDNYPLVLNNVIAKFVGQRRGRELIFDLCHQNCRKFIHENGKCIRVTNGATANFISSYNMDQDIITIQIECIFPWMADNVIGIISNIGALQQKNKTILDRGKTT